MSDRLAAISSAPSTPSTGAIIGFVHANGTTIKVFSVHLLDGGLHRTAVVEGHKSKPAGPSGITLGDNLGFGDWTELFKGGTKPLVRRSPR